MSCRSRQLRSDERGMILVVALPMAALIVGCLWYVISVGDAALHRERLQDTADATAFESAVLHARAMNAEVSLNLISASLSSVPATLRALEVIAATGEGRPLLELALASDRELSPRIAEVERVIHDTQLALRATAPLMAAAEATRNNTFQARQLDAADGAVALSYASLPAAEQTALTADVHQPWLLTAAVERESSQRSLDDARRSETARLPLAPTALAPCSQDERLVLPPAATALLHARKLDTRLSELAQKLGTCGSWATLEVDPRAENGNALLQVWSIAKRERFSRERSDERGMSLAAPAAPIDIQPKNSAFAQAEYYFDCADTWEHCAANAAWNPRWTARMRRFERPDANRDALSARRITRAFLRAGGGLESALQRAGALDARAYVHALFDAPACGQATCLH